MSKEIKFYIQICYEKVETLGERSHVVTFKEKYPISFSTYEDAVNFIDRLDFSNDIDKSVIRLSTHKYWECKR